jgi:Flp pilus assembly protein TadG
VPRPLRALRRFAEDTTGNIALIFAFSLFPLLFAAGSALDYSYASMARTKLNAAADSAALAAVSSDAISQSADDARKVALAMFNASTGGLSGRVEIISIEAIITDTESGRTAEVNYTAQSPSSLLAVAGIQHIRIGGTATASSSLPSYIDFYLLLDNTPSMGLAATTADINRMVANTPDKCAFACHETKTTNHYYALARKMGVTLRIDVVREATQALITRAENISSVPRQFRTAIYSFGESATNIGLTRISPLTPTHADARKAAGNIDLMTVPNHGYNSDADTDFRLILPAINKEIGNPGDGRSPSRPQKMLFFVSDGLHNSPSAPGCTQKTTSSGRCQMPLEPSLCTAIKDRGVRIAVLYTTYLPLPTNGWYNTWIAPFQNQIAKNMRSCASEGLFFEVSPSEGITEAMLALFQRAVAQAFLNR